jgi:hypothetical protein
MSVTVLHVVIGKFHNLEIALLGHTLSCFLT